LFGNIGIFTNSVWIILIDEIIIFFTLFLFFYVKIIYTIYDVYLWNNLKKDVLYDCWHGDNEGRSKTATERTINFRCGSLWYVAWWSAPDPIFALSRLYEKYISCVWLYNHFNLSYIPLFGIHEFPLKNIPPRLIYHRNWFS